MLKRLSIKNVALIERLDMDFDNGLNVLTGETGAGKSIIIDAVNLALGERASRELITTGAEKASVEAEFDIEGEEAVKSMLRQNELEDDGLIISRELSASGKNVCRINGTLVNLATLKQITDLLVDVHGQHEHQSLLMQSRHIRFLDSFAGERDRAQREKVAGLYSECKAIHSELLGGFGSEDERAREADILRYQINEIENARLTADEEQKLTEERAVLINAERIMTSLQKSSEAVSGDEGAVGLLSQAVSAMKDISGISTEYGELSRRLNEAYYTIEDIGYTLRDMRDSFDFEPGRIDQIEQRLEIYSNLKKKYGPEVEDVIAFGERASERLGQLEGAQEKREKLQKQLADKEKLYRAEAAALTDIRRIEAEKLQGELLSHLKDLGMEKARFEVRIDPLTEPGQNGMDRVEFMLSANPGESLKPLEKVASGGEMSRIMLAFKAIAANADSIPTLIFDEIDTGISGHIAAVVGEKMVSIADNHQVLCVTHLPQIAALADVHFMVQKQDDGQTTRTSLKRLEMEERYEYIARMMSGMEDSKLAYEHARELITHSEEIKQKRRKNK